MGVNEREGAPYSRVMRKEVPEGLPEGLSTRTGLGILMRAGAGAGGADSDEEEPSRGRKRGLLGNERILSGLTGANDAAIIGEKTPDAIGEYMVGIVDGPLGTTGLDSAGA